MYTMYTQWLKSEDRNQFMTDLNIIDLEKLEQLKEAMNDDCRKLRKEEYPDQSEYLDGIVKNDQDQINSYIQSCQEIKNKYPKVV